MNRITLLGIAAALLMLSCSTARDARTGLRDSLEKMMSRELDLPAAATFAPSDGSFEAEAAGQLGGDLEELEEAWYGVFDIVLAAGSFRGSRWAT